MFSSLLIKIAKGLINLKNKRGSKDIQLDHTAVEGKVIIKDTL